MFRSIYLIIILVFGSVWTKAQMSVCYSFDANGNRTNRTIIISSSQPTDTAGTDTIPAILEKTDYLSLESDYVEEVGEQKVMIYPNPTGGAFAVQVSDLPAVMQRKMLMFSMGGNEIYRKEGFGELTEIDLSGWQNGTYVLRIILGDNISTWKIVKQ